MEEPLTDDLLAGLLASSDVQQFVKTNKIGNRTLPEYLQFLLTEHKLVRAEVVREAQINDTFGYQIFMGQRHPSRDKVLQLAFAMHLNLQETNRLLQAAGVNELYCKNRRDAIMVYDLDKGRTLLQLNEDLYRFGEETLC